MAQVLHDQWKDERLIREGRITWFEFKRAFLDRLFPFEQIERKMQEFINLRQGGMSLKEYRLKFTQLTYCASEMVPDMKS